MGADSAAAGALTGAAPRRGHALALERICHRFGAVTAVDDVDLEVGAGELVALLGPSGCGKTTLLRIIAGFLTPVAGRVLVDGEPVGHLPPHRRGVGIVFQSYALFPHMRVDENVSYGLEAHHVPRARIRPRVEEMLRLVHMEAFADRLPRELSGGQQQRVALARCLAVDPKLLLLDEPFGALDKSLRLDMQIEVKRLQREYGITTVLVTHDQEEALSLADRIAVMNHGRIEQLSPPIEIYDRPATLFVNRFVGASNVLPAVLVAARGDQGVVRLAGGATLPAPAPPGMVAGARVVVSVRPEHLRLERSGGDRAIPVTVKVVLPLGPAVIYEAETTDGTAIKVSTPRTVGAGLLEPGARLFAVPTSPAALRIFPAPDTVPSPGPVPEARSKQDVADPNQEVTG
ncbi:MAG TPA: ABC transporter ATP-binding protein [Methylomirabilota bacterium]|nr:ABC transporter ATP-binding protein [Methylomirabilota bacterium]